ncbi:hypothetical protein L1987_55475 [Smallanthus sonchifolius]|uniref:Uncharacterized protein n=1 Tax=Smallanthus sonchifolius TaxID=185202 RepID=A0ACB9E9P4_9ASTR|nr:hypothetical protein L1987_55475 [Smallanthus sonchifolius]
MKSANQIKKQSIKSPPKTPFFKLNHIFFIFLLSSVVCLCFYTHHLSNFTDYKHRHYIFLFCNGILVFLIFNFHSTNTTSPKENQPVVTYKIKHQPLLLSSNIEQVPAMEEHEVEIEEENDDDDDVENGNWDGVTCYYNDVSIIQDQETEHRVAVVEEHETEESEEIAETEELNNRCSEFIRQMRERMKLESSSDYSRV